MYSPAYSGVQAEERFKRVALELQRARGEKIGAGRSSPNWPSVSSIHVDSLDFSYANGAVLQDSKTGSLIESASRNSNLRKTIPFKNYGFPKATSSVKNYPSDIDNDKAMMPPPSMYNKSDNHGPQKVGIDTRAVGIRNNLANICINSLESFTIHQWTIKLRPSVIIEGKEMKKAQLIIEGKVDLNIQKTCVSEPITERISSNEVVSNGKVGIKILNEKHGETYVLCGTFVLSGNIFDERNDLPSYVRDKFYNGFPDDWKCVLEIWNDFKLKGELCSFRWPRAITDSDDDLQSEITEFTYRPKNTNDLPEVTYLNQKEYQKNIPNTNDANSKKEIDKVEHPTTMEMKIINRDYESSCENIKDSQNTSGHHSMTSLELTTMLLSEALGELIKADKLSVILSLLADSPPDYMEKLIGLVEHSKYFLRIIAAKKNEDSDKRVSPLKVNSSKSQENLPTKGIVVNINQNNENCKQIDEKIKSKLAQKINDQTCQSYSINNIDESSDDEMYMGVPSIPSNRLIKRTKKKDQSRTESLKRSRSSSKEVQNSNRSKRTKSSTCNPTKNLDNSQGPSTEKKSNGKMDVPEGNALKHIENNHHKPKIKSVTAVNLSFKTTYPLKEQDLNQSNGEIGKKIDSSVINHVEDENIAFNDDIDDETFREDIRHPFLTYDSDEFEKTDTAINNKSVSLQKVTKTLEIYGSKKNPKVLVEWRPDVVNNHLKNNIELVFKGKLKSEGGQIINRKFITHAVSQRHSASLIETKNNEFFKLAGGLHDRKKTIPMELQSKCRSGCPNHIKQFCEEFLKAKQAEKVIHSPGSTRNKESPKIMSGTRQSSIKSVKLLNLENNQRNLEKPTFFHKTTVQPQKQSNISIQVSSDNTSESESDSKQKDNYQTTTRRKISNDGNYDLRKRSDINYQEDNIRKRDRNRRFHKPKTTWSLEKQQRLYDALSDDQASIVSRTRI